MPLTVTLRLLYGAAFFAVSARGFSENWLGGLLFLGRVPKVERL